MVCNNGAVGRLSDGPPVWALADTVRKVACP